MKFVHLFLIMIFQLSAVHGDVRINLSSSSYEVVGIHGGFGTYGPISKGDILEFDPNFIIKDKPHMLKFKPGKDPLESPYLSLHDFRLETVMYQKGSIIGYSFFSRYGVKGAISTKLRFDLRTDSKTMFIVYEVDDIIQGTINLKKLK